MVWISARDAEQRRLERPAARDGDPERHRDRDGQQQRGERELEVRREVARQESQLLGHQARGPRAVSKRSTMAAWRRGVAISSATLALAGAPSSSAGVPTCTRRPCSSTAMRSPSSERLDHVVRHEDRR